VFFLNTIKHKDKTNLMTLINGMFRRTFFGVLLEENIEGE